MHVLLVGGTGLISTGITRQLDAAGHDVTCYTRGETDARIPESVEFVHGDRTDYEKFEAQMADLDVDAVVDMVCFTPEDAESAIRAFSGRVDRYVFCSTIDVYSRPVARMPLTEETPRHPPTSEYGEGKADAEDRFFAAYADEGFPVTILRPWHTYGEGGQLIHTLGDATSYLDRIRAGKPIVVHGDGTSVWAPCHRDDVARSFVSAVETEGVEGEAYHVTAEEHLTWNEYHRTVATALDAPEPDLVHVPTEVLTDLVPERTTGLRDHFQYSTVFDNSKARAALGHEQTIGWEEGVRRTVEWLDDHDRIDSWESDPTPDRLVEAWRDARAHLDTTFDRDRSP
ncbi:Nucleoside-diphosphate-sugar epimerase [Halogranum rubrum]|uniref:Nucleoside-diphosphate-sugar epimerase n=1 Tax=Halogranum rubrum TaxID=553466 RepID=A0A1I4HGZ5_9EURY|nr:NAD-dependent epimerase/dehydratase family protein [Halogranum rubrum]SFL41374.1 Nucleoside-diphosphate-sugar epimerase [Halogranum rubrum]